MEKVSHSNCQLSYSSSELSEVGEWVRSREKDYLHELRRLGNSLDRTGYETIPGKFGISQEVFTGEGLCLTATKILGTAMKQEFGIKLPVFLTEGSYIDPEHLRPVSHFWLRVGESTPDQLFIDSTHGQVVGEKNHIRTGTVAEEHLVFNYTRSPKQTVLTDTDAKLDFYLWKQNRRVSQALKRVYHSLTKKGDLFS